VNRWGHVTGEEGSRDPRVRADARRQQIEDALHAVDAQEALRRRLSRTPVPEMVEGGFGHDRKWPKPPPAG